MNKEKSVKFKEYMKDTFEEALEEFNNYLIEIPVPILSYECPECGDKEHFVKTDVAKFKCEICKCEARIQMVVFKRGIHS